MSQPVENTRPLIGRHPVDAVSLVAGLLAVGTALLALSKVDLEFGLALPVLLVLAGTIGLLVAARRSRG